MNFLAALVRKPHFALAIALYVLIAAALSIPTVPVALYPSVARPAISVSCTYPGANAREVMNTVAGPIEEKVNGVEGMSRMTSTCSDTGSYSLTVTFHVGVDRDMALTKVQSKVQQALSLLPQEVKNTGVTVESGSTEELGLLTLRSANGKLTREQVVDYAYGVVNPAILRVPGVGSSTVKDNKVAMRIWLDAKKMASHGISSDEVVSAIKSQNVQASLGSVGASPTDAPECKVISLISKGRLDSAEDFERIVVRTEKGGGIVRLGDIARVGKGLQGYTYSALYDETPAVFIRIVQLPGVDVRKTMKAIKAELAKLEPSFPADLTWDMTYDTTRYMDAVLRQTLTALAFAFLLAVSVAGLYLRSVRGVALTAFASLIPVAAAFAMLSAVGYFINLVSLYAFIVATGISVVFSAVMVWRIQEIIGEDRDPEFAAALAVTRHVPPFVAAALAIAAAMVPVAMVDGMQGVLYRQFSLVLGIAVLIAGLTSLVIVPAFAARVLRRGTARTAVSGTGCPQLLTPFVSAVVLVACGLAAWGIGANLPKEFIPSEDLGVVIVDCKTAEGTSMPVTADVMRRIYRKVRGTGGIEKSVTLLGESIVSGNGENNAKTYLILDDWSKRDHPVAEIVKEIKRAVTGIPDAKVYTICSPPMQGQGNQSGLTVLVQSMEDADPVRFANEMQRFLAALQRSPLAASANCGTVADVPHLRVHVDREKCELMKVPMLSLYTTLQHALGSVYVNDINLGTQVNRVTVMSDWEGRAAPDRVSELYVRSQTGDMVPVDTLVAFSEEIGVRDCYRCNQYLYATAQFIPKEGVASSEAIAEVRRISKETLPHGYIQDWSGLIYEQFQSRGDTGLLFGLSILAVYVVMMVLFGSGSVPLMRMLPSAAAILGAVLLHAITSVPMSFYSQFAILLLAVICTAVSLLATDRDGFLGGAFPALVLAVVAIPLVFTFGAGSAGSRSLGVALLGGFVFYSLAQGTCCQNGSTCYNVRMRKNLLVLLPLICAVILFGGCTCSGREPVSARYRTPGIIGGMGPSATCDLMQKIIDNTDAADDQHNIHLLVDQNTDVPDRTAAILRGGADPMPELVKSARRLEKAGADFLCMSCNTAHYFHERLSREVSIPILNMPAESAKELKRRGVRKVGLLATDGTIRTGVYHRFLKAEGIEVVVPDGENQATVMALIYDCVKKNVSAKDYPAEAVARTIADLKSKGAEAYLLACTELPIAFERLGYKEGFLDPTLVLARAVVRAAGAPIRDPKDH